jgi:hypothetical protein
MVDYLGSRTIIKHKLEMRSNEMAYISAEDVKAVRKELKAAYPKYKFSVRKGAGSYSLDVTLVKGPRDLSDITATGHSSVNQYHLDQVGKHEIFFKRILEIMKTAPIQGEGFHANKGWYDDSDSMTDYFNTAYYLNLSIGSWNKPYEFVR